MKNPLLALSLLATTAVFAEDCDPCCEPVQPKCIDCECYTPAYYDLQCDWGIGINVEFLYWYAYEDMTPYAASAEVRRIAPESDIPYLFLPDYHDIDTDWDPGVRVGLAWKSACDGWDLYLNWTYFKNTTSDTVTEAVGFANFNNLNSRALITPLQSPSSEDPTIYDQVKAKWKLRFNQIDLVIGRKYWLSPCFTMRPFAGVRGAWTDTRFEVKSTLGPVLRKANDPTTFADITTRDRFENCLWGVGLVAGLEPNWHICSNFILFANFDASILWGGREYEKTETSLNFTTGTNAVVTSDFKNYRDFCFHTASTLFGLGIGLRWEESWCCDRFRTAIDLGWEHHVWLDHGYRILDSDAVAYPMDAGLVGRPDGPGFYSKDSGDLFYGGLVVRVRFDF